MMSTPYSPDHRSGIPSPGEPTHAVPATDRSGQRADGPVVLTPRLGTVHGDDESDSGLMGGQDLDSGDRPRTRLAERASRGADAVTGIASLLRGKVSDLATRSSSSTQADVADADAPATDSSPAPAEEPVGGSARGRRGGGRRRRQRDDVMVPPVEFSSYYGRNIVKPAPWKHEIPTYLYLGGLAAGSALVAAGGEMTGRTQLQRNSRLIALAALGGSTGALIKDLGKPSRFVNMMRTVKLTSPMSVGSWILAGFGAFTGVAAVSEVMRFLLPEDVPGAAFWPVGDRLASLGAGAFSAPLAAYTAVLLSDTATPTWHEAYRQMPFVFVGSALAAAGGAAMTVTPPDETAPARRMAVGGAVLEYGAYELMERALGICAEPLQDEVPGAYLKAAKALTLGGAALTAVGGRYRPAAVVAGVALNAGSALTRFGIFEAGMISARDPKYTVVPQRERLERRRREAALAEASGATTTVTA